MEISSTGFGGGALWCAAVVDVQICLLRSQGVWGAALTITFPQYILIAGRAGYST